MFSIKELSDLSGTPPQKIRYYVRRRLLPPPTPARGRHAAYSVEALRRLRYIRTTIDDRVRLTDLVERWNA